MIGFEQRRLTAGVLLVASCFLPMAAVQSASPVETGTDAAIDELVVTSRRQGEPLARHPGNIAQLGAEAIAAVGHQHINELMTRIAGVWLSRGSGQEHLTAIRSPVLTGAGSCGDFLFLEDGIPIRPSGFCNVNQMFEMHTEQAVSVEVIRGPGNALYGSNALHGIINVLTPASSAAPESLLAIEAGSNDFLRLRALLPGGADAPLMGSLVFADDGGFRDDSGYRQGKLQLALDWGLADAALTTVFSATDLDQETAGFIVGEDAYKDPAVNRSNLNPEAFRDASSQRLYALYRRSTASFDIDIRPYLRHSDMRFLQHFLPGKPLEENGHVSVGAISALSFGIDKRQFTVGLDIEWSDLFLEETQFGPTEGSDFLRETRPEGKHYDFDVRSVAVAPYLQTQIDVGERLTLGGGLRVETIRYDYDNQMLAGNTRDDGSACGFGGCLYSRPASRSDTFTNVAPKLSFNYQLRNDASLFGVLARGFRAPQATELYRLQSGQAVADLDSATIDSIELGVRWDEERWQGDAAVFAMRKRESVFRDANGFNVSAARSRHQGVEVTTSWALAHALRLDLDVSFARHRYDFDRIAARGETFVSENDVDSAPRWLGSAELLFETGNNAAFAMQWASIGDYYLDAENRFKYPGHSLLNLRARIALSNRLSVTARLNNLLDEAFADRADYAFGNFRYFPGRGRELFIELRYLPRLPEKAR
ncbi:MAG: TonB-dependent receptor [Gammaproteobacteria bacterium]|nr:TonB-dependent receptor [Gammaproteobacteria bacterium]